jgi:hypothetical protein
MPVVCAVSAAFAGEAPAVKLQQEATAVKVVIGGQLFSAYNFAGAKDAPLVRPFFGPVLAADGTAVTSDEMVTPSGDHHFHHRSLWVGHGDVNGADHWSWKEGATARQKHVAFTKVEADTIVEQLEWEGKTGEPVLKETRTLRFFAFPDGARGIDLASIYQPAAAQVTFGDTKEAGLCSVRVVKELAKTALLSNSTGATGEKDCWGKRAAWCDISGTIGGKPYGVAVLDHPANPRHPGNWHVRQYGLLSANIFGLSNFDKSNPKGSGNFTVEPGKPVTFRYRVVIHQGDAKSANLDAKFKEFCEAK